MKGAIFVIYFPTTWEAKEYQNLPNLKVVFPICQSPAIQQQQLGGGFKVFFIFTPIWGDDPI